MEHFLKQMIKLSMGVMISSLEASTKTVQEILQKTEDSHDGKDTDGADDVRTSTLGNLSRLAIMPFFEISRLPVNVFASVVKTISQAKQEIRIQGDGANSGEGDQSFDSEIVPLNAEEIALETKAILTQETEETSKSVLWQIGRSGRNDFMGKWTAVFDYHLGTDADPINSPGIPHLITVPDGRKPMGATEKLNIHFTLDRDYPSNELAFIYDRWGAEKDQVFIDGGLLAPIGGTGKGKFRHVALSLKDLSRGDHVITITTSGETDAGGHRIDYLELATFKIPVKVAGKNGRSDTPAEAKTS